MLAPEGWKDRLAAHHEPFRSSNGSLKRLRILAGAQGEPCALAPQLKAFKQITHRLAKAIVTQTGFLNVVHQLPAERGCAIAQQYRGPSLRILVKVETRVEHLHQIPGGLPCVGGGARLLRSGSRQGPENPPGDPACMRQVQCDVKEGRFVR